jgi:hypothetical protein
MCYRSKQLVKAIKDVYGPHSDPKHKPGAAPKVRMSIFLYPCVFCVAVTVT